MCRKWFKRRFMVSERKRRGAKNERNLLQRQSRKTNFARGRREKESIDRSLVNHSSLSIRLVMSDLSDLFLVLALGRATKVTQFGLDQTSFNWPTHVKAVKQLGRTSICSLISSGLFESQRNDLSYDDLEKGIGIQKSLFLPFNRVWVVLVTWQEVGFTRTVINKGGPTVFQLSSTWI
jgi:hypothetical protein